EVIRKRTGIWRLPFLQGRQTAADIAGVEMFVAGDFDLADARFDYSKHDHTALEFLLREKNLDRSKSGLAIGFLQRLERALDVREIALLTSKGCNSGIDLLFLQQCVAFDPVLVDIETQSNGVRADNMCRRDRQGRSN